LEALPDSELEKLIQQQLNTTFRTKFEQRFSDF
jgi:hypothetical protein